MAWFEASKIEGIGYQFFTNEEGKKDYRMIPCPEGEKCRPLWARFYTLEDNRPFFCGRDGIMKFDVSEIEYERRTGYSWYNGNGEKLQRDYQKWKKKMSK